ncbi:unnamed protein product, partial [Didymodactylos carnosus]
MWTSFSPIRRLVAEDTVAVAEANAERI